MCNTSSIAVSINHPTMITPFLIIWTTVLALGYYIQRRHLIKLASTIPGPKGYPIIGNALMFWGKPQGTAARKVYLKLSFCVF